MQLVLSLDLLGRVALVVGHLRGRERFWQLSVNLGSDQSIQPAEALVPRFRNFRALVQIQCRRSAAERLGACATRASLTTSDMKG